jgi:hypothetical protein
MYISKKDRETIKQKYGGLCAYSGTPLEDDWQVDHIHPKKLLHLEKSVWLNDLYDLKGEGVNSMINLVPCQKLINHYKRELVLDQFRDWYLGGLHTRIAKLPKNPRTEKSIKHKAYMLKIAEYFCIKPDKPLEGKFYFEKVSGDGYT